MILFFNHRKITTTKKKKKEKKEFCSFLQTIAATDLFNSIFQPAMNQNRKTKQCMTTTEQQHSKTQNGTTEHNLAPTQRNNKTQRSIKKTQKTRHYATHSNPHPMKQNSTKDYSQNTRQTNSVKQYRGENKPIQYRGLSSAQLWATVSNNHRGRIVSKRMRCTQS